MQRVTSQRAEGGLRAGSIIIGEVTGKPELARNRLMRWSAASIIRGGRLTQVGQEWEQFEIEIAAASDEIERIASEDPACQRLRKTSVWDRWCPRRPSQPSGTVLLFARDANSLPGPVWYRVSTRLEARPNCTASASAATSTCVACSLRLVLRPRGHRHYASGAPTRSKSNDSRDANRRGVGNSVGEEIALLETNTHAGRTMKTPDRQSANFFPRD